MLFSPQRVTDLGRLTHLAHCGYDEVCDVHLRVAVGEIATIYAGDFRTNDEVAAEAERNLATMRGNLSGE